MRRPRLSRLSDDGGARCPILVIRKKAALSRMMLYENAVSPPCQCPDGAWRHANAIFMVFGFSRQSDQHELAGDLVTRSSIILVSALPKYKMLRIQRKTGSHGPTN